MDAEGGKKNKKIKFADEMNLLLLFQQHEMQFSS